MYAKLQYGFLRSAPKTIVLDGKTINNPLQEELEQLGYKQVVYTDTPTDAPSGQHYESGWDVDTYGRPSLSRAGA
jgi:hypothetical protein